MSASIHLQVDGGDSAVPIRWDQTTACKTTDNAVYSILDANSIDLCLRIFNNN